MPDSLFDQARLSATTPIGRTAAPTPVTPAAACETCGTMVAASTRTKDGALGYACTLCTQAAKEIRRRFYIAESRKRMEMEEQLRRVVREVRSGTTDLPTFDQPDF